MVATQKGPLDILLGFLISNIPINPALANVKLGASHKSDPTLSLPLDQTRLIDFSPERVRDQLDAETTAVEVDVVGWGGIQKKKKKKKKKKREMVPLRKNGDRAV